MTNDKLVADLRKRFEGYTRPAGQQGRGEMSTLVTILRPIIQLGMNSWLDFGLWRSRRVGSPTTVAEGYRATA